MIEFANMYEVMVHNYFVCGIHFLMAPHKLQIITIDVGTWEYYM